MFNYAMVLSPLVFSALLIKLFFRPASHSPKFDHLFSVLDHNNNDDNTSWWIRPEGPPPPSAAHGLVPSSVLGTPNPIPGQGPPVGHDKISRLGPGGLFAGAPKRVGTPEVVHSTASECTLQWSSPQDGGAALRGYTVEIRRRHGY